MTTHKINTAAITLFEEFGQDFTLEQLGQKTDTSRATLYRRVGSKDALLKSLADQGLIKFDGQSNVKARILAATRIVVGQYGFINCTMDQIANQADLGIATLYRHFAEKENLLRAFTVDLKAGISIEKFELNNDLSVKDGLEILVKTMLNFINDNQDIVKILFFGNPDERKYISEIRETSTSTFKLIAKHLSSLQSQKQITSAVSVDDLVASLMGLMMQFALTSPLNLNRKLNPSQDAKLITEIFCNGILNNNITDNGTSPKKAAN